MIKHQGIIVLAITLFIVQGAYGTAFADQAPEAVVSMVKTGYVTGVSANEIQIDGYSYKIKVGAEILDHEGAPLLVMDIGQTAEVKFFLKNGEIQKMIVTLPR
ncbi:MAG: hypothetical protein AAB177_08935 [Nitrospirota bacterium]|jgi:hypothetical protein